MKLFNNLLETENYSYIFYEQSTTGTNHVQLQRHRHEKRRKQHEIT